MTSTLLKACNLFLRTSSSSRSAPLINWTPQAFASMWRYDWYTTPDAAWPNYKPHFHHHKHQRHRTKPFSEGLFKHSLVRVVDNSEIGNNLELYGSFSDYVSESTMQDSRLKNLKGFNISINNLEAPK